MAKKKISQREYMKYVIISAIVAIGFLSTEIYGIYIERKQEEARQDLAILKHASKLELTNIWNKLIETENLSIQDDISFGYLGCNYTTKYTGTISGNKEYAKNTSNINADASLNYCPRSVESLIKFDNGEGYWLDGEPFIPNENLTHNMLLIQPKKYLETIVKNISDLEVSVDPNIQNIIKGSLKGEKGTSIYTFTINDKTKLLTEIQYSLDPEASLPRKGKITLKYEYTSVRLPLSHLSTNQLITYIGDSTSTINITSDEFTISMNRRNKTLSSRMSNEESIQYNCNMNQLDCQNKATQIAETVLTLTNILKESKDTVCAAAITGQVNTKDKIIIKVENTAQKYSFEATMDLNNASYAVTQQLPNNIVVNCFEGEHNKASIANLYNQLKNEAEQLTRLE